MNIPFTHEQFLDLFQAYNLALWPAVLLLWLITVAALISLYRRRVGGSGIVAAMLALHWAWSGVVYHFVYFRSINPAATIFGALFLLQALLFVWRGVVGAPLDVERARSPWGRAGLLLIAYALLYPAIGLASGLVYPRLPLFAVPCPTTILTAGVLLLLPRRHARILAVIPILWSIIGGSAAFLLGVPADLALVASGALLLIYVVTPATKLRGTTQGSPARRSPVARDAR